MLREQIGLIGLVARVGGHSILLGREGTADPRFETGVGKDTLQQQVIVSGSFDGHNGLLDLVLLLGLSNVRDRRLKVGHTMLQRSGLDQQDPEVVSHHPTACHDAFVRNSSGLYAAAIQF